MEENAVAMPRAILFDWDNTLVDTWPCIIQAMNVALTTMGHAAWSEQEAKARIAKSMRDSFPVLFGDRWEEAKEVFQSAFQAIHLEMLVALPGAESLLAAARNAGIYLAVVSNKTGAFLRAEAEALRWEPYFSTLVGAGDAAQDKPAIDPVHMALKNSGISAGSEVWFVGDNAVDVQCGGGAGCVPILLHPNGSTEPLVMDPAPQHVFCGCSDLQAFLTTETVPFLSIR
jgi:phosphoglycolate phosphatase